MQALRGNVLGYIDLSGDYPCPLFDIEIAFSLYRLFELNFIKQSFARGVRQNRASRFGGVKARLKPIIGKLRRCWYRSLPVEDFKDIFSS